MAAWHSKLFINSARRSGGVKRSGAAPLCCFSMVASPNPPSLAWIFIQTKELAEFNHRTARDQQQKKKNKKPRNKPHQSWFDKICLQPAAGKSWNLVSSQRWWVWFFFKCFLKCRMISLNKHFSGVHLGFPQREKKASCNFTGQAGFPANRTNHSAGETTAVGRTNKPSQTNKYIWM